MKQFQRLFEPRSIAVVGVSEDPGRVGSQAVHTLMRNGYAGAIYPVNPRYPRFEGLKCYPSIAAIEDAIDLVVIGVPARGVVGVIEECAQKRVPYAVILSGGFREIGPAGAALQERMLGIAREAGMRIVGPNCLGLANIHNDVYAAFGSITRPPKLRRGVVSLVTQSGGFGYSIALACSQEGIGFRNVIATGNEADIDMVEFIEALLDDDETQVIVAYIEGLKNGRALLDAGRRALAVGKPLLVWKGGITNEGARAAATHTANMTGSYDVYQALFKQAGIVEIRELYEAADYIKAFAARQFPAGRRVSVMGGSGGSAIVFADAAEQAGLTFASFTEDTKESLSKVVPEIGSVQNPVDFTAGYFSEGNEEKLGKAVQAVVDDPGVDAVCINFATASLAGCIVGAHVAARIARGTAKPILVFLSTPASDAPSILEEAKIPVVPSPVRAARAIAMLAAYGEARSRNASARAAGADAGSSTIYRVAFGGDGQSLSETESKAVLARLGIAVTRDVIVQSSADPAIGDLEPPLAVKIASQDIAHKTEIGGVKLNVRTREELDAAVTEVLQNAAARAPLARVEGVIVSEMVSEGFELLAGAVNDPSCGPVVVVGAGGIYAEIFADRTCRLAPFDEQTALEMIGELKCSAILRGARGRPPLDIGAVASVLSVLSRFAWENRDTVAEVDVNPLFALPRGAIAADALVVCKPKENQ